MLVTNFGKPQEKMAIFWGYVRQRDVAICKSLQKNFSCPMPPFLVFPKELLLNPDAKDEEPTTIPTHNQEPEGDEARKKSVHIESDDEGMDTTQTTAPALQTKAFTTA
ncbi:hypothetical protein PVK06_011907 [Gossypium arboreum]|uniref:Uncharacterized protein n=1 Tax=Gossypium arboreum TaxID=29729 RepID=A0ABR0QAS5_GOSAR|nr:hypothetical protein PVK06_011907 [Gossypium arboreum]